MKRLKFITMTGLALILLAASVFGVILYLDIHGAAVKDCQQQAVERPIEEIDESCKPFIKTPQA